ncbi:MAG: 5-formyltetrahydrofolate cyclo-ligase [Sneathiella sp.]|nr:5-formyltetrahydrofolate cyclo-ligase [Sneathiella sp.]
MTINLEKQKQRDLSKKRRATLVCETASRKAATIFLKSIPLETSDVVGIYYPHGSEIDPLPLAEVLCAKGVRISLPVVVKKAHPLEFRLWRAGEALESGAYGIPVPPSGNEAVIPDLVVVPMLAFDEAGARMGYGGGFYDRTLQRLREMGSVLAIGYAYSGQKIEKVITDPLDQPLDWIVTEQTARKIQ